MSETGWTPLMFAARLGMDSFMSGWSTLHVLVVKLNANNIQDFLTFPFISFSSCQRNLIKTFQIEGMIALITKMTLIVSSDL